MQVISELSFDNSLSDEMLLTFSISKSEKGNGLIEQGYTQFQPTDEGIMMDSSKWPIDRRIKCAIIEF